MLRLKAWATRAAAPEPPPSKAPATGPASHQTNAVCSHQVSELPSQVNTCIGGSAQGRDQPAIRRSVRRSQAITPRKGSTRVVEGSPSSPLDVRSRDALASGLEG